jgi:hypothetical protein
MPGEPDGRQDVHNRGVDVQMAAVNLCGQTDLPTGPAYRADAAPNRPVTTDVRVRLERPARGVAATFTGRRRQLRVDYPFQ